MTDLESGRSTLALCSPHDFGAAVAVRRRMRVGVAVLSMLAGFAAVALVVASDPTPKASLLAEYYQPWQERAAPEVNLPQLAGGFAEHQASDAERGVMHALYRSANGDEDSSPLDPSVGGAPAYATELNFLQQELPTRRTEEAAASPWRQEEQLRQQAERVEESDDRPVGEQVLETKGAVKDVEDLERQAPPGYHLAWMSNGQTAELAKENGGRDELPYFPMPPLDAEQRAGNHVEWAAPGPCMLRDGTDMQSDDAECQHH